MRANEMSLTELLKSRISTRAFLSTPVPESMLREILDVARWSPSGGNLQPWKVIVVTGAARDAIVALGRERMGADEEGDRPVYPPNLWEPHRTRRYQVGEQLYGLLGIPREDKPARLRQLARNYQLFDAPAAMFFVIDERMGHGQWAHLGMFMQSCSLAAADRGLATCFQEFWGRLRKSLKQHFGLPENELVYCGMAIGHADPDAPINRLRSERAPVDEFATFRSR